MVAIVTGSGQGLVKSSLAALGSQGEIGTAKLGQNGSAVTVNAANGNLIVQSQDEMLFGLGLDDAIVNSYNSKAAGWQENYQRKVGGLTGTVNTSGSTITHTTADGSTVVYTYNTTLGKYVGNELGGAYDTLAFNSSTNQWTWTEGKSRAIDVYDNANGGRLIQSTDTSNNSLTYTYTGTQLTRITTQNGDYTSFVYTGSLLTSIVTSYTNASGLQTETRVRYGYDTSNRLTTVTTDLSPNDNSIADGKTYVTTYSYINTSNNIGTITESDGTSLTITYDSNVRVASLTQTTASGVTNASYLTYGTGRTMVTDQQGNVTTLVYDSNNQLIQLISPPATPGGSLLAQAFSYDANGNLLYSGPAGDPNFTNIGLNWGNLGQTSGVGTTQTTEVDGGVTVYRRQTTATPSSGFQFNLAQTAAGMTAVSPGQSVTLSVYAASSGASQLDLRALWYNAAGTYLGSTIVSSVPVGGTLGANGVATANFASGTINAISGAAFVAVGLVGTANGTAPLNVAIAQPAVTLAGLAVDPNFTNIGQNWGVLYTSDSSIATTQTTEMDGGVSVYRRQSTSTPPAGWAMNLQQAGKALTRVLPGQTVNASIYAASSGASSVSLVIVWYDANGNYLSGPGFSITPGGTLGSSGVATANYASGSGTAPAGAYYVGLAVQGKASGTGPLNVAIAQPTLTISSSPGDPNFTNIAQNWGSLYTSNSAYSTMQTTEIDGGVYVYRRQSTSTPPAGWAMNLQQLGSGLTPIIPGQTVNASLYAASSGASSVSLVIGWYDANGNYMSGAGIPIATGGTLGASGVGTAKFATGSAIAPAGAVYTGIAVQGFASGSAPLNIAIAKPTLTIAAPAPNAAIPTYNYTYDTNGNRLSKTDSLGNQTTYGYDGTNQLVSKTEAANSSTPLTTRYVYDSAARLVYTISPRGDVTQYVYNTNGTQKSVIQYTGNLYTAGGNPLASAMDTWVGTTDRTQTQRTDTTYDARGLVATVTTYGQTDSTGAGVGSSASITTYVYDQAGLLLSRKLSSSTATETFVYDGLGRTLSATDYNGKLTQTVYTNTASGLQTATTLANGTVRTSTYDKAGELVSVSDNGGGLTATTTYVYDSVGNLIRTTDPTGLSTYHVYDALNRKVADVAADGSIVAYGYNANDQLVSTTAYATKLTAAQLALLSSESNTSAPVQLASVTPAADATNDRWSWSVYDADGRLAEHINGQGEAITYSYDAASRLISTTGYATRLSAATVAAFKAATPTAVVLPAADATNDRTTRNFYNSDDQLVGTLDADGYLTEIVYDTAGRKVRTIAHATQTQSSNWASGTLAQLQADAGSSSGDIYHWWVYDGRGLLRAEIDGEGNITRYDSYTAHGDAGTVIKGQVLSTATLIATPPTLAGLPAPSGTLEITSLTYDQYGHVLTKSITLTGGAVETTTYAYDPVYNLISQATVSSSSASGGADGRTTLARYDGLGRKALELTGNGAARIAALGASPTQAQIDAVWAGNQIKYDYDAAGRLIARTDSDSRRTLFYYDVDGRLTYQVDGTGGVTQYSYDTFGERSDVTTYTNRIAAATLPSLTGGQITATLTNAIVTSATDSHSHTDYTVTGTVADTIDPLGVATAYGYNPFGDLTSRTDPLSSGVTTMAVKIYSRRSLLLTSTADVSGLALATNYQYDAFGRVTQVTDAKGNVTKTTYDRAGRVLTEVDGLNLTTSYSYDGFGHVLTTTDANGKQTTYAYSLFDRQVTVTDPNGIVTTTTKNAYGQTVKIVDGTGAATTFVYDADGNLTSTTDANGNIVTRNYSSADVMTSMADARGVATTYAYDAAGRMYSQTVDPGDGLNLTTTWAFDGKGQTVSVTDPTGMVTVYSYDLDGHALSRRIDANGVNLTTSWTYDQAGRTVTETSPMGKVTQYVYDNGNRLTKTIVAGVTADQYVYDADGNLVMKTDPAGNVTRSAYDADNRLAFVIDPTGAVTGYYYDNDGRVVRTQQYGILNTSSGVQTLAQMQAWGTANAGNDINIWATYDASGRLLYSIDPDVYVTGYLYDNDGRVVQKTRYPAGTSWAPLPATPPAGSEVTRYTYDAAGNKTFVIDPNGAVTGYTYDGNGNVTQTVQYATLNTSTGVQTQAQMQAWLSANSNAVANNTNNRTTTNLYDSANRVIYMTDAAGFATGYNYDGAGRVVREIRYLLGAQDLTGALVSNIAYDTAGRKTFVTDPTGAVTKYSYDADGHVVGTVRYAALNTNTAIQSQAQMQSWVSTNAGGNDRTTSAQYTYSGTDTIVTAYDAVGVGTQTTYNFRGDIKTRVNNSNSAAGNAPRTTTYAYDGDGRLTSVTDPLGTVTRNVYDTWGRMTSTTVAYGTSDAATTTYLYDADGRVLNKTVASGTAESVTTWNTYDAQGRVTQTLDGNNNATTYIYDNDGRVLTTTDPTGAVTTNTYNAFGDLTSVKDPNGNTGYFYYDKRGQQILAVDALGYATAKTYDINGKVTTVTRYSTQISVSGVSATPPSVPVNASYDNTTSFGYDNDGRVIGSSDGNGYVTGYSYNTFGDRLSMANPLNGVTTYTYNARGEMLTQSTAATSVAPAITTAYTYDAFGNRTKMVEAQGRSEQRTTNYVYDADNRLTSQTGDAVTTSSTDGATSSVTPTQSFVYDNRGNQTKATDANGAVTYTYYDHLDRKVAQVDALNHLTAWTFDRNNNMLSQTRYATAVTGTPPTGGTAPTVGASGSDRTTSYTYDKDNRQTSSALQNVETGKWTGSGWTGTTGTLTTATTVYDADGNAIKQTDANGNATYTWYDKLGRKIAQVDASGYMTAWTLDAEGNAWQQIQYANPLTGPFTAGGSPPAAPAGNAADRTTAFTYDHDGQRLTETRKNASWSTVSGNSVAAASGDATVIYEYNALGQVTKKIEATGDQTTYQYDNLGRLSLVTTAAYTAAANATAYTYDGLGNILTTVAGSGTSGAETTTFTYGAGGRLATKTDATGFVTTYGYDADGRTTVQSYSRVMSNGASAQEASLTNYDALGETTSTAKAAWNGRSWVVVASNDSYYNSFGEVIATGTNTGGSIAKAQVFSDYDNAGRVWRSNSGDGVVKVFGYDGNGNQTVQAQSLGTTDLRNVSSLDAALSSGGVSKIYSLYDARNELTDIKRPISANLDGTIGSGGNAAIGTSGLATFSFSYTGGPFNGTTTAYVTVSLSNPALTTNYGTGNIHVNIYATNNNQTATFAAGSTNLGTYALSFADGAPPQSGNYQPPQYQITVIVNQDTPSGGTSQLGATGYTVVCYPGTSNSLTTQAPVGKSLTVSVPNATATTMYVRPKNSSGGYTKVVAAKVYDTNGAVTPGAFFVDLTTAPFSTMGNPSSAANTSWDVVYVATDASGTVVDAKRGTVNFDGSNPPVPTPTSFSSVNTYLPSQNGDGTWTLNANSGAIAYSDSTQAFNAFGDVTSQTDARGNTTNYSYDALGDMVQKTAPQVTVVGENGVATSVNPTDTYYYDKSGRQIGHRDANNNLMTQELLTGTGYDGTAALTTKQYNPDGGIIQTAYDIFGNATTQTDAMGMVTTNTYDKDNRLLTVAHAARTGGDLSYTSGVSQLVDTYVYDGLGQRIKHTNNFYGSTAETTDYDMLGRVTKSVSFGGQTTSYSFVWNAMTATGRVTAGQAGIGSWTQTTTNVAGLTASSTTDFFGKVSGSTDFGSHSYSFTYNLAGQLSHQGNSSGQSLDYIYTSSGQIANVIDNATGIAEVFAYDKAGNRTVEGYYRTGTTAGAYQNAAITYDALNRVTEVRDANADITYSYDADGNRREAKTVYVNVNRLGWVTYSTGGSSGSTQSQDYWYKYDSMNRFVLTKGVLSGGAIVTGSTGTAITYDARGDRMSATYGSDGHAETYAYTNDGYLKTVLIGGVLNAARQTDVLGRNTVYTEYQTSGSVLLTRAMTYDGDNRVTNETDQTYNGSTIYTSQIINHYKAYVSGGYTGADQGVITHSNTVQTQTGGSGSVTTDSNYYYTWWNQAKSSTTTVNGTDPSNPNATQWQPGNAAYSYDINGNMTQVNDGGVGRVINYQVDSFGQVLSRRETDNGNAGVYRNFFYLNGQVVGDVGTDQLVSQIDYAQQMSTDRSNAANAGASTYQLTATPSVGLNANFDENYQAYNAGSVGNAGSSYSVMAGDTLQSIAQNVWGDSSLWYLLADANGLSAGANLAAGQSLTIPDKVTNLHNGIGVSKPYNASDALSNTTPTLPQEPQPPAPSPTKSHGCGVIGDIIATIVSFVVRAATVWMPPQVSAGLADIARQGVEIAVGNQKKFNWAELGMAIVSASIPGSTQITSSNPWVAAGQAAIQGMETNVLTQGVSMALGIQKKFDWTGVAVAGAMSGAATGLDFAMNPTKPVLNPDGSPMMKDGKPVITTTRSAPLVLKGAASLLAGAVTRTIVGHDSFGKSLKTMLPDAIGSTIGQMVYDKVAPAVEGWYESQKAKAQPKAMTGGTKSEVAASVYDSAEDAVASAAGGSMPAVAGGDSVPRRKFLGYENGENYASVDVYYESDGTVYKKPVYTPDSILNAAPGGGSGLTGTDNGIEYVLNGTKMDRFSVVPWQSVVDNFDGNSTPIRENVVAPPHTDEFGDDFTPLSAVPYSDRTDIDTSLPNIPSINRSRSVGSLNYDHASAPGKVTAAPQQAISRPKSWWDGLVDGFTHWISGVIAGWGHHGATGSWDTPSNGVNPNLGSISRQFEAHGPGTVSTGKGDHGGVSYGSYQMTRPTVTAFLKNEGAPWSGQFAGQAPGSPEFTSTWHKVANANPDAFFNAQHDYINRTHYQVQLQTIRDQTGVDLTNRSYALQDVVWSTAVQLGARSGEVVSAIADVKAAGGDPSSPSSDADLIRAIYAERGLQNPDGTLVHFASSSLKVQEGVRARYIQEQAAALRELRQQRILSQ